MNYIIQESQEERKNKKNKTSTTYKTAREKFIEALSDMDELQLDDVDFWKKFQNEYVPIFKDRAGLTNKDIVLVSTIYGIFSGDEKIDDISNYADGEKEIKKIIDWYEDNYYEIPQEESDMEASGDVAVLMDFLKMPLNRTKEIFEKFGGSDGNYHYIEGSLPPEKRVLLVAHADTVWDGQNNKYEYGNPHIKNGVIQSSNPNSGIGADDRAGIAMLWLLKDSGHSILITNYEEVGRIGAKALVDGNKELHKHIQDTHNFVIQLDRQGATDYKCYYVGSPEFRTFLNTNTYFSEPNRSSFTDICTLCETVCGVNLSIGYYNEHRTTENLVIKEWQRALDFLRTFLAGDLPRFDLKPEHNITTGGGYRGGYYDDWDDYGYRGNDYDYFNKNRNTKGVNRWGGYNSKDLNAEEDNLPSDYEEIDYEDKQGEVDDLPPTHTPTQIPLKIVKKIQRFLDRMGVGKEKKQEFEQWLVVAKRLTDKEYDEFSFDNQFSDNDIVDWFAADFWDEVGRNRYYPVDRALWGNNAVFVVFEKLKKNNDKKKYKRNVDTKNNGRMLNTSSASAYVGDPDDYMRLP